jgi:regulator of sirC expression with transglutaminase-like and TPR domain
MDINEINALINLLDDPDSNVYNAIRNKLTQLGAPVIPHLEKAWETSLDELFQTRIENIIQVIHHTDIKNKLQKWNDNSEHDLLEGAAIISQFQYSDVKVEDIYEKIERIKKDIWLEINNNLTALEKIKIVNHIFFDVHNFSRSKAFYNSIQGFFINHLLNTKKGSPIALAIVYASICQQLDIPVYGVALPKNFILCFKDKMQVAFDEDFEEGVLFYINPFNKGVVFGKKEIELFIKQQKLENKKAYFQPSSNKDTLIHLLKEIIVFYENNGDKTKVENYQSLLKILYF